MEAFSSLIAGLIGIYALLFVGIFVVYFSMLFFLGLMFYYFTGDKKHGENLLAVLMRKLSRLYAEVWMFFTTFGALFGLGLIIKVVLGAMFKNFTYAERSLTGSFNPQRTDLEMGLILFILSLVIFVIHFAFGYVIQTNSERRGSLMVKLFTISGLAGSSIVLFGTLFTFVMQLVTFGKEGMSNYGAKPGVPLAFLIAALPFWIYYAAKAVITIRRESVER